MTKTNTLEIANYRFECNVTRNCRLSSFLGSRLRSVFGNRLRERYGYIACKTDNRDCLACERIDICPYPAVFKSSLRPISHKGTDADGISRQRPANFALEIDSTTGQEMPHEYSIGDRVAVHLSLIGKEANSFANQVLQSLWDAIEDQFAGERFLAVTSVTNCFYNGLSLPNADELSDVTKPINWHSWENAHTRHESSLPSSALLIFAAPVQFEGKTILEPREVDSVMVLGRIESRTKNLLAYYCGGEFQNPHEEFALATKTTARNNLSPVTVDLGLSRSRGFSKFLAHGLVGTICLNGGSLSHIIPYIELASIAHIGAQSVNGFGGFRVFYPEDPLYSYLSGL